MKATITRNSGRWRFKVALPGGGAAEHGPFATVEEMQPALARELGAANPPEPEPEVL